MRKLIGTLHLWLGMVSGLVIIILGITGCLYAFIDEIRPLVYQHRIFIKPTKQQKMLPLQELKNNADAVLKKTIPLLDVEIYADDRHTIVFRYRERNNHANLYTHYFINYFKVYINPFTGEVVKVENSKWEFFNLVVMLHCSLLLGHLGTQIITWSTIIFLVMLISGLILWWPKNKAAARKRFTFNWKQQTSWKRKNYDVHQISGFYIFIIAFFIAITGLAMLQPAVDNAIKYVVSGGKSAGDRTGIHDHHVMGNNYYGHQFADVLDRALEEVRAQDPGAYKFRIYPAKNSSDQLKIKTYKEHSKHNVENLFSFNQNTAHLITNNAFAALPNEDKLYDLYYDIHVGAILSLPGKILAFLVSLITATLPISGFLIWKARRKNKPIKSAVDTAD